MSEFTAQPGWTEQLKGRWQIPLLMVSMVALALGVWRLKPTATPPTFEELCAHAGTLREAGLLPEASTYIESLLRAPERKPEESRRLHRMLAEVIFDHEKQNLIHGPSNVERIIEHTYLSVPEGTTLPEGLTEDPALHEMRALAFEWLRRSEDAVLEYRQAVLGAKGPHIWELRKRVLDIRRATGPIPAEELEAEWDAFVDAAEASDALKYWAIESKIRHFEEQGRQEQAEQFLLEHASILTRSGPRQGFDYLQALAWYHAGRLDEAERLLRSLRDRLVPGDPLYARTGWLLGCVLAKQDSPEPSLAMFDDVIENTVPGAYRTAAWLGRAEMLARVERFEESADAYAETLRLVTGDPYDSVIDLRVVRESTTALYQSLLTQSRLTEAMSYLRVAARLVSPSDKRNQAAYTQRVADLATALGREELSKSRSPGAESGKAKALFTEAGEEYLRLSQLVVLDAEAMADATWKAADVFDLAGLRRRTQEVLIDFIQGQPANTRTPMAYLRLGQACQVAAEYEKAIHWYQENLTEFPRTWSAIASLVPLAECFQAVGRTDMAETTLLRIVTRRPDDPMSLITPAALEYRDALFALGSLYSRTGQYEKSMARYEEAIERYPQDLRTGEATYLLADVYRHSAQQLWRELTDGKGVVSRTDLRKTQRNRLQRARILYEQVIEQYRHRPEASLTRNEQIYLQLSHFCRADAAFDLAKTSEPQDLRALAEAVDLYDRAAWTYQRNPMAMTAYIQMIDCQLMLGNVEKARMALQRARWTLRGIPDEALISHAPSEDRVFWEEYLTWLEHTPTLSRASVAAAATQTAQQG